MALPGWLMMQCSVSSAMVMQKVSKEYWCKQMIAFFCKNMSCAERGAFQLDLPNVLVQAHQPRVPRCP